MIRNVSLFAALVAVAAASLAWGVAWTSRPAIGCKPSELRRTMSKADVAAVCGSPRDKYDGLGQKPWYPLRGESPDASNHQSIWVYGNTFGDHVNVYFDGSGHIEDVQVFGEFP
jgi:hypothetical protein